MKPRKAHPQVAVSAAALACVELFDVCALCELYFADPAGGVVLLSEDLGAVVANAVPVMLLCDSGATVFVACVATSVSATAELVTACVLPAKWAMPVRVLCSRTTR